MHLVKFSILLYFIYIFECGIDKKFSGNQKYTDIF